MARNVKKLWVDKYSPQSIDQYIFNNEEFKTKFKKMIATRDIPHLLLSGSPGIGKTTLSDLLVKELEIDECDVLRINASDENSVDVMREKILSFISTFAVGGHFKVVQLEEADYLSQQAYGALRVMMVDYSNNARFILTCNHDNKIAPAIKSRCTHFHFKNPPVEELQVRAAEILLEESIEFEIEVLEKYVAATYPDIRKLIGALQENSIGNKLIDPAELKSSDDYMVTIIGHLERDDLTALGKTVKEIVPKEEYETVYQFLYSNLSLAPKFKKRDAYEAAIVLIASYLYKHSMVALPDLNFEAMCIELSQI